MNRLFFQRAQGMMSVAMMVVMGIFTLIPTLAQAQSATYTVSGYAFSDMSDASDQIVTPANHYGGRGLGRIEMSGTGYGVQLASSGQFSGYAWNDIGGYALFDGVSVDSGCLSVKTRTCPVTGDFVFVAARNTTDASITGGWDGVVRTSDPSWITTVQLGAEVAGVRTMSGYAWGGDVVGWVDFKDVKVSISDPEPKGCTDPTALNYDPIPTVDDGSCCYAPNIWNATAKTCTPPPITDCKIQNDPKYNPDPAVGEDNTKCQCPNGDYNQITKQCGNPPSCPIIQPNPNFPGMPGTPGYNAACPIACKSPTKWNITLQRCELDNGDQCPTTKVDNPLHDNYNQNDPQTIGIQTTANWPTGYNLYGNRCGITGCSISYAKNYSGPDNTIWTIQSCQFCPKGEKYDTTTNTCVKCLDPNNKNECPLPPKGFISPVTKEV